MFKVNTDGLLGAVSEASRTATQDSQKLFSAIKDLNAKSGVKKIDREKELRIQEEQLQALKDIANSKSKIKVKKNNSDAKTFKDILKGAMGAVGGGFLTKLLGKGSLKNIIKFGGIPYLIYSAFNEPYEKIKEQIAKAKGINVEDLSFTAKIGAFGAVLGEGLVSITNKATDLINQGFQQIGIDLKIPSIAEGKVVELQAQLGKFFDDIGDNIIENTDFGETLVTALSKLNNLIGKTFSGELEIAGIKVGDAFTSVSDGFRQMTDIFMKQSDNQKEFIKVAKQANDLEDSYGYVEDKDREKYNALKAKATELARKLKEDKNFQEYSGYAVVANKLLDPVAQAKQKYQTAYKRTKEGTGVRGVFEDELSKEELAKREKESDNAFLDYVNVNNSASRTDIEKANAIIQKRNNLVDEENRLRYEEIEAGNSQIEQLKNGIDIQKELMNTDQAHKEIYLSNIERMNKTIEGITSHLEDLGKELGKETDSLFEYRDTAPASSDMLELIAKGEGTSDATARKHGYKSGYDVSVGYGKYTKGKPELSKMTFAEVFKIQQQMKQDPRNKFKAGKRKDGSQIWGSSSAVGKYQFLEGTLKEHMRKVGLNENDTFSPENQDKMAESLLRQAGSEKFKKGKISSDAYIKRISNIWASVEGNSYGQGVHTSKRDMERVLATNTRTPRPKTYSKSPSKKDNNTSTKTDKKSVQPLNGENTLVNAIHAQTKTLQEAIKKGAKNEGKNGTDNTSTTVAYTPSRQALKDRT